MIYNEGSSKSQAHSTKGLHRKKNGEFPYLQIDNTVESSGKLLINNAQEE